MSRRYGTAAERLALQITGYDTSTPIVNGSHCLLCDYAKNDAGYPRMRDDEGRYISVSRVVWETSTGAKIASAEQVLHECDNPACIEFRHLFLGDHAVNAADRNAKRRQAFGERNGRAKLTAVEVHAIRIDPRKRHEIAAQYGISLNYVSRLRHRGRWNA